MTNSDMPAMPFEGGDNNGEQPYLGLTKREHFAGLAMQAFISGIISVSRDEYHGWTEEDFSSHAVKHADALLAELEKGNG